jgi:RNA polymerase sigma-70 factor, ECF subfamily
LAGRFAHHAADKAHRDEEQDRDHLEAAGVGGHSVRGVHDGRLIERAKAYDETALSELYHQYVHRLFRYVYARVGDPAIAEDLVSDVYVRMLESLPSYEERGVPFEAWLYRIAHGRVVDYYRRQKVRNYVPLDDQLAGDDAEDPEQRAAANDDATRAWQAMNQLTPDQQQVLSLRFLAEYSSAEVAVALEKTEGSVKALQHRALATLRRLLEGAT